MNNLPIYLLTLRKVSPLSQKEVALLLKMSPSSLCKLEKRERRPSIDVVIGSQIIFGESPADTFPALCEEIEFKVMAQAKLLYDRLEKKADARSIRKREFLLEMIGRLIEPTV